MAALEPSPTTPLAAPRSTPEPGVVVLVIAGPIARGDIPWLCERARTLLEASDADLMICDVGALAGPDVVTVDALAQVQLTARRLGRQIRLRNACDQLRGLLALLGLCDVLPLCAGLRSRGQSEQREQGLGVEERVEPDDPTV